MDEEVITETKVTEFVFLFVFRYSPTSKSKLFIITHEWYMVHVFRVFILNA